MLAPPGKEDLMKGLANNLILMDPLEIGKRATMIRTCNITRWTFLYGHQMAGSCDQTKSVKKDVKQSHNSNDAQ